ncbi:MAG: N-acyl amino acid synthase FeeM domain-containing protein [Phycisphaerae bacterium]
MANVTLEPRGVLTGDGVTAPLVRRAASFTELLGAFALVQENYVRLGYKTAASGVYHFSIYNLLPATVTLIGELGGAITGTVSLVPDSPLGMPCADVFPELCESLRREGHRLGEATMLADRRMSHVRAWPQLRAMLRMLMDVAAESRLTKLIVLCHPHHAAFYLHRLPFRQAADVRPCPHVNGSPAVPLTLDLLDPNLPGRIEEALGHWGGSATTQPVAGGYRLTDQRAAALVAVQPPVLIDAKPKHRRLIVSFYPTLAERLRRLDVGRILLST